MNSLFATLTSHPIVLLFLAVNLGIGLWAHFKSRVHSFEDYALASRNLPTAVLVMTLLATKLESGYLAFPDYINSYGLLFAMGLIAMLFSFSIVGTFIAPRLVYFQGCLTIGDLMATMYGEMGRVFSGAVNLVVGFLIVGSQIQAIAALAKSLLGIPPIYAVPLFGGIVVLYSVLGGMKAVSYTDVFQLFAGLMVFIWILRMLLKQTGDIGALWENLQANHPSKMRFFSHPLFPYKIKSALFWEISLVWVISPPILQRMLVIGDKREVKKMWYIGSLVLVLIRVLILIIGMIGIVYNADFMLGEKPKDVLLTFVNSLFSKQPWMIELIFGGLVAFGISTMDSFLHATSLSFAQDVINPISQSTGYGSLHAKQKTLIARLGVLVVGILAIVLGATETRLENKFLHMTIIHIYAAIIIPLLIGVSGLKPDKKSWGGFILAYVVSLGLLYRLGWSTYGNFLLSLSLGIVAYLLTHIYLNRGIVTLHRDKKTITEKLWVFSGKGLWQGAKAWVGATFHLPNLARTEIVKGRPIQSLGFSIFIFGLYVLNTLVISDKSADFPTFMVIIQGIGVLLCCGLMLEGVWPTYLKPFFPLYWFSTLFYCLPLSTTITFLRMHEGVASMLFFLGSFVVFTLFVSSRAFFWMTIWGLSFAHLGWYAVARSWPQGLWANGLYIGALAVLALLMVSVASFGHKAEVHADNKLYMNKAFSYAMTHETLQPLNEISIISFYYDQLSKSLVPIKNNTGEKGFFISEANKASIEERSVEISSALEYVQEEYSKFKKLLKYDISSQKQERTSIHKLIKELIPSIAENRYAKKVNVTITCLQDFKALLIRPLFRNVLDNLVRNARAHGGANQIDIRIDGKRHRVYLRDNGKGIPEEILPKIFDLRFTTRKVSNSGVGLALIHFILAASGVRISCHARHGDQDSFTEFIMEFPVE